MFKTFVPTVEEWASTVVIGTRPPSAHGRVSLILAEYHAIKGKITKDQLRPNIEKRKILLLRLGIVAKAFVFTNASSPYVGCFISLGMKADKQLDAMSKAASAWGKVRTILAPSGGAHGVTKTIQHHFFRSESETTPDPAPTSSRNYWLEALDPKHRSWGHEDRSLGLFDRWKLDTTTTLGFFDWLEHKHLGQGMLQVQYLAPDERWRFMCIFGDDKLMYRHQAMLHPEGPDGRRLEPFSSRGLFSAHSGSHVAIWVCSPDGIFYTHQHEVSKFHHSSFLSGKRVLAAGEWVVSNGRLLLISHKTGHYAATPIHLYRALQLLRLRLDLSKTVVEIMVSQTIIKHINALDFIDKSGEHARCASITVDGLVADMKTKAKEYCARHADWSGVHTTA